MYTSIQSHRMPLLYCCYRNYTYYIDLVRHDHSVDDLKLFTRAHSLFRSRVNRRLFFFSNICPFCLAIASSTSVSGRGAGLVLHPSRDNRTHITLSPRICHGERLELELPLTTYTFPQGRVQDTQWKQRVAVVLIFGFWLRILVNGDIAHALL